MSAVSEIHKLLRVVAVIAVFIIVLAGNSLHAQDRDSELYRDGDAQHVAAVTLSYFDLGYFDLVATGRFGVALDEGEDARSSLDRATLMNNRDVVVPFIIDRVYQGPATASPGTTVHIQLPSDMLAYPGELVSRSAVREQMIDRHFAELQAVLAEIDALELALDNGSVKRAEHDTRRQVLDGSISELLAETDGIHTRRVVVSHGYTFHQVDGVIVRGDPYLIAVSNVDGNSHFYSLDDISYSYSIFWGEWGDDVRAELEARQ